ncbi:hypothetical protein [Cardiobacterium hominis]|uniref:hypothetical protein n=1 Tax=Cardiobacterium hominis TaxID=2718 RepID=UPI00065F9999|nr:hypothetical protein [Cardiobacterium hominis]
MTTYRYPIIIPRRLIDKTVGMVAFDGEQFTLDSGKSYPAEALADMHFGAIGYPARTLWSLLLFLAVSLSCLLLSALFFYVVSGADLLETAFSFVGLICIVIGIWAVGHFQPREYLQLVFTDGNAIILRAPRSFLPLLSRLKPEWAWQERLDNPCPRWARIPLGLCCWALCGVVMYYAAIPDWRPPDKFFRVCVLEEDYPRFIRFADKAQWQGKTLCPAPYNFQNEEGFYRVTIQREDENLYAALWNDGPADPFEYVYRVNDDRITPLKQRMGLLMARATTIIFAAFPAAFLYALIKVLWRFYLRRRYASR